MNSGFAKADRKGSQVKVLLVDNRDSFTLNLAHAFADLGADVALLEGDWLGARDDLVSLVRSFAPNLVCIGPGPRGPKDLPALVDFVRALDGALPLLGVCLGMQALTLARGGRVERAAAPIHGMQRNILHDGGSLFDGLPSPLPVMRYHSLICADIPPSLTVVARSDEGEPMAVEDVENAVLAMQFHPESVGTSGGLVMLRNVFARICRESIPQLRRPSIGRVGAVPPPTQPRLLPTATLQGGEDVGSPLRGDSPADVGSIYWVAPKGTRLARVDVDAAQRIPITAPPRAPS